MTTQALHCSCAQPLGPSGCTCMQSQPSRQWADPQPGQPSPNLTFHGSFGQPVPNFSPHSFSPYISQPLYPHESYVRYVEQISNDLQQPIVNVQDQSYNQHIMLIIIYITHYTIQCIILHHTLRELTGWQLWQLRLRWPDLQRLPLRRHVAPANTRSQRIWRSLLSQPESEFMCLQ